MIGKVYHITEQESYRIVVVTSFYTEDEGIFPVLLQKQTHSRNKVDLLSEVCC